MSSKECKTANWKSVGFSDAMKGRSVQLSDHRDACAKVQIQPNSALYMSGYNAGSRQFCNYQSGLRFGKRGRSANNICSSAPQRNDFFRGYDKGKRIYTIEQKISSKESERRSVEKKIRDVQKGKVKSGIRNLDLLYREKELINREINALKREQRSI
jgi:hypothetical protein